LAHGTRQANRKPTAARADVADFGTAFEIERPKNLRQTQLFVAIRSFKISSEPVHAGAVRRATSGLA
jgi:hypothetical protein